MRPRGVRSNAKPIEVRSFGATTSPSQVPSNALVSATADGCARATEIAQNKNNHQERRMLLFREARAAPQPDYAEVTAGCDRCARWSCQEFQRLCQIT